MSRRVQEDSDNSDVAVNEPEPSHLEHLDLAFINSIYRVNTGAGCDPEDRVFAHGKLFHPTADKDETNDHEEEVEETIPGAIEKLNEKTRVDLTAKLVRYLIYQGISNSPIRFSDISKEVFPRYKNVSR